MTWVSQAADIDGHTVLEFPRGPRLGKVRHVGTRLWVGICDVCRTELEGRTRPEAARLLAAHVRSEHWSPRR